ncbi:MAG: hypothetical protein OSA95_12420, partial [Opitutales bacterium]|nr:hypothetical protein [Opitutales bacterium]
VTLDAVLLKERLNDLGEVRIGARCRRPKGHRNQQGDRANRNQLFHAKDPTALTAAVKRRGESEN